ncbi:MAG: hypothetical protein GC154_12425 [bacterium]|nr:hypothetical protein [bacterium]
MRAALKRAGLIALALFAPLVALAQAASLSADFENGSLGGWALQDDGAYHLTHAPLSAGLWYYFRVDNARGQTLRFVFDDARKDYFTKDNLPVISYDQIHWSVVTRRTIVPVDDKPASVRFEFEHAFAQNRAWLAYAAPFSNAFLGQCLQSYPDNPYLSVETLCRSPLKDQPIPLLHITDPQIGDENKKTVLIVAREDALESASSWAAWGAARFLASDDPAAAAIRKRARFIIAPLFDAGGVAMGAAVHPFAPEPEGVYWTETWQERRISFFEQRELKRWLQRWSSEGRAIDYAFRLHSEGWGRDNLRREQAGEDYHEAQDALFVNLLQQKYMPWYENAERTEPDSRLSKFVWTLFPAAIAGMMQTEFLYAETLLPQAPLYKTTEDLMLDGELLARGLGEALGAPAPPPPPFIQAARVNDLIKEKRNAFAFECVYRDLQNRPPTYVRVMVNDSAYEMTPAASGGDPDYSKGVLYTGFVTLDARDNTHYFEVSNGELTARSPQTGVWPGPYWLGADAKKTKR